MSSEQYWRNQLAQTEAEYEQIIQGLRDEVEKQRKRCGELMHEQAMQRATAAADVRDFCQQYITEAKQQQHQQHQSSNTSTATAASSLQQQQQSRSLSATHAAGSPLMPTHHLRFQNNNSSAVESVPLPALLTFLHEYSHGLLPLPENRRKRERLDASLSPLHHRLRQRMLARHRMTGREDYVLMEDGDAMAQQQQQQQLENAASSPMSPPMGPSTGAPVSGLRFNNAVQRSAATGNGQRSSVNPPVVPASVFDARSPHGAGRTSGLASAEDSERLSGSGGGGGGPVMAASAFGLPTLPPR